MILNGWQCTAAVVGMYGTVAGVITSVVCICETNASMVGTCVCSIVLVDTGASVKIGSQFEEVFQEHHVM